MLKYHLNKDTLDERDYIYNINNINNTNKGKVSTLPISINLRQKCPAIYDQGEERSCTANVATAARTMILKTQNIILSRAFLYYQEINLDKTTRSDIGANIRDICKALYKYGICEEIYMPYTTTLIDEEPSSIALRNALKYKIKSYQRLVSLNDIKTYLFHKKQPVIIGMDVYESMETEQVASTGILPMPLQTENLLGGHAVLIVGYDDNKQVFIVRNSWGVEWGDKGYFYMSYEYFEKYTRDYWVLIN